MKSQILALKSQILTMILSGKFYFINTFKSSISLLTTIKIDDEVYEFCFDDDSPNVFETDLKIMITDSKTPIEVVKIVKNILLNKKN